MASRLKIAQEKYGISAYDINSLAKISGKDNKYIDFVCKTFANPSSYEDGLEIDDISDSIRLFEKYKSKLEQKDLNKYTMASLKQAISELATSRKDLKNNDVHVLYEDDTWKVVHPTTFESAALYSSNTKWCISQSHMYNDYNKLVLRKNYVEYKFLFIIINKLTNQKIGASLSGETNLHSDHNLELYDEKDLMFFGLGGEQKTKYKSTLNKVFTNLTEEKQELSKEDFSDVVFKGSVLPFVQVNDKINLIYNKFISYLYEMIYEIKFNFDLNNKCFNLVQNKDSLLTRVYSLESSTKILETLNKHFKSEVENFDHIMKIHDEDCKFLDSTKKIKSKAAKKAFDFKSLDSCDCNKFNNLIFLKALQKSLDKAVYTEKLLENNKVKIVTIVQNKIKFLEEFNKNRPKHLDDLLKKESKSDNIDFVISKLNLSRDEALFLQVKSESAKVKNYCKSAFKIPDDFAKEMLALKNINNLSDIAKV